MPAPKGWDGDISALWLAPTAPVTAECPYEAGGAECPYYQAGGNTNTSTCVKGFDNFTCDEIFFNCGSFEGATAAPTPPPPQSQAVVAKSAVAVARVPDAGAGVRAFAPPLNAGENLAAFVPLEDVLNAPIITKTEPSSGELLVAPTEKKLLTTTEEDCEICFDGEKMDVTESRFAVCGHGSLICDGCNGQLELCPFCRIPALDFENFGNLGLPQPGTAVPKVGATSTKQSCSSGSNAPDGLFSPAATLPPLSLEEAAKAKAAS